MRRFFPPILLSLLFLAIALTSVWLMSAIGDRMFGDWRLVFVAWGRQDRLIALFAASVIAVGCIGMLFAYEQRLVSRQLGYTLLTLRVLLILILFLTLLEPVWTWSYNEDHKGRVVVAIDLSESMDTRDVFASEAEKLRWARSLGMLGNEANTARIERWIAAYESGQQPDWIDPDEQVDAARRQPLAEARQQNLQAVFKQLETLSRKEILQRLILSEPNPLSSRLKDLVDTQFVVFAGEYSSTPEAELSKWISSPAQTLMRGHSDLTLPLMAEAMGGDDLPLVGVIVFSDGHDNVHDNPQKFAAQLASSAVPVHTVLVGSERRPKDLAIISIDYPEKVFQDDDPIIKATLRTSGFLGERMVVKLTGDPDSTFAPLQQEVTVTGDLEEVSFKLSDLLQGRHHFRLATDVLPGETRDDNNDREFSLDVVDDQAHVLLVEGEGRWEFRYLQAALERDERVDLQTVLFDQPYVGVLPETFFPRSLPGLNGPNNGPTPFARFDAVIIGDVSPVQLNLNAWTLLDRYVREEGGTLILTAGHRSFPRAFNFGQVADLLPVENLREVNLTDPRQTAPPEQRGFHLQITPDGAAQAMLQLDVDPLKNERVWSSLPGHTWALVGQARRTATVWAAQPGTDASDESGLDAERKRAVIAQHYVGAGQVVWIGIDSTWRWRFRVGDQYHHRFWGQLARWAVEFKASAGNQFVRFGAQKPVVAEGEQILLRAQWDERYLSQNPQLKARAVITRNKSEEPPVIVDLVPQEGRGFIFEARTSQLMAGDYTARLQVDGAPLDGVIETELSVSQQLTPELQDVSANRSVLEQAASLTGGRFLLPDQLHELPDLFHDSSQSQEVREEIPVWNHWPILVLFCIVGTSEWVLRKINGLP